MSCFIYIFSFNFTYWQNWWLFHIFFASTVHHVKSIIMRNECVWWHSSVFLHFYPIFCTARIKESKKLKSQSGTAYIWSVKKQHKLLALMCPMLGVNGEGRRGGDQTRPPLLIGLITQQNLRGCDSPTSKTNRTHKSKTSDTSNPCEQTGGERIWIYFPAPLLAARLLMWAGRRQAGLLTSQGCKHTNTEGLDAEWRRLRAPPTWRQRQRRDPKNSIAKPVDTILLQTSVDSHSGSWVAVCEWRRGRGLNQRLVLSPDSHLGYRNQDCQVLNRLNRM